jgi:hypothetical protein
MTEAKLAIFISSPSENSVLFREQEGVVDPEAKSLKPPSSYSSGITRILTDSQATMFITSPDVKFAVGGKEHQAESD